MSRGLWRWWEEKDGADIWRARIEVQLGEWRDVDMAAYERDGLQPSFWELPLKEDYQHAVLYSDPLERWPKLALLGYEREWVLPAIIALTIVGCLIFSLTLALTAFGVGMDRFF